MAILGVVRFGADMSPIFYQNLVFTEYGGACVLGLLGNQRMRQSISLTHLTISPHHHHHHHHHQFKQHVVRPCGVWWHECTCSRKNPRHLVNIDFKSLPVNQYPVFAVCDSETHNLVESIWTVSSTILWSE